MTQFRAKTTLYPVDSIHRAHIAGDLVPEENIERNNWQDKVERVAEAEALVDGPKAFDPAEHTAAEVNEYLASADEEERERVLTLERQQPTPRTTIKGL